MLLLKHRFALVIFSVYVIEYTSCVSKPSTCPTWLRHPNLHSDECVCGSSLHEAVNCDPSTANVHVAKHFCIFFSSGLNTTLFGTCPYSMGGAVPKNVSQLNNYDGLCRFFNRKDVLCGACEDNYTLSVYSYYLGCVQCEDYKYGWIKFITVAFLPVTLFYIVVILFRISATSSALNGYVLVSQLVANPIFIHKVYSSNEHPERGFSMLVGLCIAVYAIWNLDFFRSFYKPICLYPDLKYQHVLLLDYAIAVYPLLLIFITFICVKLHDNFAIVVWLWRPFHKYLVRLRKQWNIQSYLVNALATFIILSYVKILNVSFEFLLMSNLYNMDGKSVSLGLWYFDGRVDMTSIEYLPYLLISLCMLLIFNILPLVLLTLYPFKCFQTCLNCVLSMKVNLALQIFMDTIHGCYKNSGNNYRHFAALYLAVRFLDHLLLSIFRNQNAYIQSRLLCLVFLLAIVAKFQPYKCRKSNMVDIILLLALICGCVITTVKKTVGQYYPRWLISVSEYITAIIPPSYALYLLLSQIWSVAVKRMRKCVPMRMDRFDVKMDVEEQPLLNDEITE